MPQAQSPLNPFLELARQDQLHQQRQQVDAMVETQIRILAATFDKAAAYTNFIVLTGYAGFFGLWQLTKEFLPKNLAYWSALLMLISVVLFVAFEIVKMIYVHHNMQDRFRVLQRPEVRANQQELDKALKALEAVHERVGLHLMRVWSIVLALTIATAMSGATVLGYVFIAALAG